MFKLYWILRARSQTALCWAARFGFTHRVIAASTDDGGQHSREWKSNFNTGVSIKGITSGPQTLIDVILCNVCSILSQDFQFCHQRNAQSFLLMLMPQGSDSLGTRVERQHPSRASVWRKCSFFTIDIPTKSNATWSNIYPTFSPHGSWHLAQNIGAANSGAEVYSWLKSCPYPLGLGWLLRVLPVFPAETLEMGVSEIGEQPPNGQ